MSVIEATSRQVKTMADGTLRLTVDISPESAQDAFMLFGSPDVPMVLARLKPEVAKKSAQNFMIEADKPKGGELARLAGMWCQDPNFWKWIGEKYNLEFENEEETAAWVRDFLLIDSRAELDSDQESAKAFHEFIRIPYSEWLNKHGG